MKKNLLSKLCRSVAVLGACLTLIITVLPSGIFIFEHDSDTNSVSTYRAFSDDELEDIKNP